MLHLALLAAFVYVWSWHLTPQANKQAVAKKFGWFFQYITFWSFTLQTFQFALCLAADTSPKVHPSFISLHQSSSAHWQPLLEIQAVHLLKSEIAAYISPSRKEWQACLVSTLLQRLISSLLQPKRDSFGQGLKEAADDLSCSVFGLVHFVTATYYVLLVSGGLEESDVVRHVPCSQEQKTQAEQEVHVATVAAKQSSLSSVRPSLATTLSPS